MASAYLTLLRYALVYGFWLGVLLISLCDWCSL